MYTRVCTILVISWTHPMIRHCRPALPDTPSEIDEVILVDGTFATQNISLQYFHLAQISHPPRPPIHPLTLFTFGNRRLTFLIHDFVHSDSLITCSLWLPRFSNRFLFQCTIIYDFFGETLSNEASPVSPFWSTIPVSQLSRNQRDWNQVVANCAGHSKYDYIN